MHFIRGYYRLSLCSLFLIIGATFIIVSSFIPVKIGRYSLAMWCLNFTVRSLLWVLNIKVRCDEPHKLRELHGFIFPNHVTYLDTLIIPAITPTRFLSKNSVRTMPVVGQVAKALGFLFVKRSDKSSRLQAREAIMQAERFPPITLFPEGKRGPGRDMLPFRYGAFEIVAHTSTPFVPVVIAYDRLDKAIWHRSESILNAIWRLAARKGGLTATITPLEVISPTPLDDPVELSKQIQAQMQSILWELS